MTTSATKSRQKADRVRHYLCKTEYLVDSRLYLDEKMTSAGGQGSSKIHPNSKKCGLLRIVY